MNVLKEIVDKTPGRHGGQMWMLWVRVLLCRNNVSRKVGALGRAAAMLPSCSGEKVLA